MKRWIAAICALAVLFGLGAGCKKKDAGSVSTFDNVPLETIIEQIYDTADIELPMVGNVEITKENASYYLGTDEIEFKEAIASEALITAVPFSLCLVRVENREDAESVAKRLKETANPNKWICVGVESGNVLTDYCGDVVLLVMADQAAALRAAFQKLGAA